MRPSTKIAALAAAAVLALAACDNGEEPAATPAAEAQTDVSASEEPEARVDELQAELDMRADELQTELDEIGDRLGDVDPGNLRERVREAEAEIERLSEAVAALQDPTSLGSTTVEPEGEMATPTAEAAE